MMTQTSNPKQSLGRNWVHYTAFLPLPTLLLAKAFIFFPPPQDTTATLLLFLAIGVLFFAAPILQFAALYQMVAFGKNEISRYQRGVWFTNAAVCWTLVFVDPGGSLNKLFH